ncbi:hypothetical protein CPB86DRAFT_749246 [Serendipita vermifera]|nr:hypothetical protein CPB86DRAFT_749246 [Serendipita vermifera]
MDTSKSTITERNESAAKGQRALRLENEGIYGQPLPRVTPVSWWTKALEFLGLQAATEPDEAVVGVMDVASHAVWIYDEESQMTLWRRGFFGKGNLSRSEPTWLRREINRLRIQKGGGKELTAEELTAKRREVRRRFKHQRAEAMAAAEAEAETAFAHNPESLPVVTTVIPSTQTAKLNQQLQQLLVKGEGEPLPELAEDEVPENLEHLQLSPQEAFFLAWTVGCLHIFDEATGQRIALPRLWEICLQSSPYDRGHRVDNPFLIQYVVYHHFRSLGWVVKTGIKFCVDFLLYKRGPVFHHAEFAVIIVPSYSNPKDKTLSPYNQANVEPLSWQWLSTLSRANSQVMKTLVLVYVVIPSSSDVSDEMFLSPKILELYSVKEVIIRRFIASRMRD